jgi:hypothetical protein
MWPLIDPTVEWWPGYPIRVFFMWPLINPTVEWWPGYPIGVSFMWPLIDPTVEWWRGYRFGLSFMWPLIDPGVGLFLFVCLSSPVFLSLSILVVLARYLTSFLSV